MSRSSRASLAASPVVQQAVEEVTKALRVAARRKRHGKIGVTFQLQEGRIQRYSIQADIHGLRD